jgi:hypothetical protein
MMAAWQRRVSYAPSAVTVPISSPLGIWSSSSGNTGLSPLLLEVNSTARISDVAVSMAKWTLRRSPLSLGPMARHGSLSALNAVLARLPLAITEKFDAGAVHKQVQQPIGAAVWHLDGQCLLPPTQRHVVWHGPVQVCKLQ